MEIVIYQYRADGFWASYDDPTSQQIEDARIWKQESVSLSEGQYQMGLDMEDMYEILLELNLQRNVYTGTCRPIRRLVARVTGFDPDPDLEASAQDEFAGLLLPLSEEESESANECNVCLSPFTGSLEDGGPAIRLPKCSGHFFHAECIGEWLREKHQCPYCKAFYGVQTGNCPEGEMSIQFSKKKLPGPEGKASSGTWMVSWDIDGGIQEDCHQNPGTPFCGTSRVGYLPDTAPFRKVLRMFQIAWKRRLMFTIGTSLTTGHSNVITWNGIHVRTEWANRIGFGWPAPEYLASVTEELRAKGITEDQIGDEC